METDQERFFPSKWLTAANIDKPVDVTITKAYSEEVKSQSKDADEQKTVPVIEFDELEKPLILNKTNFKAIVEMSGKPEMKDWPGTVVQLFVIKVDAFGEVRDAIRIKGPHGRKDKTPIDEAMEKGGA